MRIIAGRWRGRSLAAPPGATTRPTADRTREALFSMLTSRLGSFDGLIVADLFAGTGALGLEALSRGAARCTFVDQDRAAVAVLRANVATLGAEALADIRHQPVAGVAGGPFDLVLLDPPYASGLAATALERAAAAAGAWASVETDPRETVVAAGWRVDAERVHGRAKLTLLRRDALTGAG